MQAHNKVSLRVITFYKQRKSVLQLPPKEIHDRKAEVLPSAF